MVTFAFKPLLLGAAAILATAVQVFGRSDAPVGAPRVGEFPSRLLDEEMLTRISVEPKRRSSVGHLVASYAPYTHHTGKGPYNSRPDFRALEWTTPGGWSFGGASYKNSFSQPCWYAFSSKRFTLKHRSRRFFAKITGGVIYGYKPPHAKAVPINWAGYTPALIPSIGYQVGNVSFQLAVFGRAYGAMPLVGIDLK